MNNAIKKLFIRYKTKTNLKKRLVQQNSTFEESAKIALFYSDKFHDKNGIDRIVAELKTAGKEVSILVFCHDPKHITTSLPHVTLRDISFSGSIGNAEATFFLGQNYDFAICLDNSNHYAMDYIFSLVRSRCRVGILHPDRKNLFEMMVSADKKETDLCCEVLKYLKMIKTYEY